MSAGNIISWILSGLVIGAIARLLLPGHDNLGWIGTIIVGIVGSFVGGFIGSFIKRPSNAGFHPAGFLMSLVGAIAVLLLLRFVF